MASVLGFPVSAQANAALSATQVLATSNLRSFSTYLVVCDMQSQFLFRLEGLITYLTYPCCLLEGCLLEGGRFKNKPRHIKNGVVRTVESLDQERGRHSSCGALPHMTGIKPRRLGWLETSTNLWSPTLLLIVKMPSCVECNGTGQVGSSDCTNCGGSKTSK